MTKYRRISAGVWAVGHSPDVQVSFQRDITLIRLCGEVDLAMRERLRDVAELAVFFDKPRHIDMTRVTFLDSTGLAFIASLAAAGREQGWVPTLVGATGPVRQTIELSRLLPALSVTQ
jgi:anti-sigma B factor antagonist